ncbi:hypothetical protein NPIL_186121 [Nephila pilipes]|uniref:Uncharacterized protein n=1 Tax=Nephila pilipes TaxID=299642 RepID=A0A8X6T2L6_NEPPI|nr:hypothetical protein NPIL_186121 [Nephila pilipes]
MFSLSLRVYVRERGRGFIGYFLRQSYYAIRYPIQPFIYQKIAHTVKSHPVCEAILHIINKFISYLLIRNLFQRLSKKKSPSFRVCSFKNRKPNSFRVHIQELYPLARRESESRAQYQVMNCRLKRPVTRDIQSLYCGRLLFLGTGEIPRVYGRLIDRHVHCGGSLKTEEKDEGRKMSYVVRNRAISIEG